MRGSLFNGKIVLYLILSSLLLLCTSCGPYKMASTYRSSNKSFLEQDVQNKYKAAIGVMPYYTSQKLIRETVKDNFTHTINFEYLPFEMTKKTLRAFQETELYVNAREIPEDTSKLLKGNFEENVKELVKRQKLDLLFVGELIKFYDIINDADPKKEMCIFTVKYTIFDKDGKLLISSTVTETVLVEQLRSSASGDTPSKSKRDTMEDVCILRMIKEMTNSNALVSVDQGIDRTLTILRKDFVTSEANQESGTLALEFSGNAPIGFETGIVFKKQYRSTNEVPIIVLIDDVVVAEEMLPAIGNERVIKDPGMDPLVRDFKFSKTFSVKPGQHLVKVFFETSYYHSKLLENSSSMRSKSKLNLARNVGRGSVQQGEASRKIALERSAGKLFTIAPREKIGIRVTLDWETKEWSERMFGLQPKYEIF